MSLRDFAKALENEGRVEGELIKTISYSLLNSFIFLALIYFVKFRFVENFLYNQGLFLFFAALSYAVIVPTIRQVRAYREMTCMSGMMIGMTTGMVAGFLPGYVIASTNGMFIGSIFGMFVGISCGIWNGKCCGVMGLLEGAMAGFMGGLMGAMTAFMLFNDHLKIATVIVFLICTFIIFALNYMIYLEMKRQERKFKEGTMLYVIITLVLMALTAWLMLFGPRSAVFG